MIWGQIVFGLGPVGLRADFYSSGVERPQVCEGKSDVPGLRFSRTPLLLCGEETLGVRRPQTGLSPSKWWWWPRLVSAGRGAVTASTALGSSRTGDRADTGVRERM